MMTLIFVIIKKRKSNNIEKDMSEDEFLYDDKENSVMDLTNINLNKNNNKSKITKIKFNEKKIHKIAYKEK